MEEVKEFPTLRIVFAAILDFLTAFWVVARRASFDIRDRRE